MAGQAVVALLIAALVAAAIIMATVSAAAAIALLMAAALAFIGFAEKTGPDIQLLAGLALAPNQAMIMAALQMGSLATITQFMQDVNLVMISATL